MDIKEIIESEFDLTVHNIIVLGQGLDSIAYLVNNEYIFKQSKHDEARTDLKKEIQVLNYLKGKITLQIPYIEYYSEEYSVCGYKEIKGNKLSPGIYQNMSDHEKYMLVRDIALFLKEMHSLPLPDIDGLELNIVDDYKGDHDTLRDMIYDKIPDRSKKYLDDLYKRILNDEHITEYVSALCHNDLSCNHIIIQNNKAVGIIDFGDAAVTDRDKDFIYLLENSSEEIGREFGLKVLEYYGHPNKDIPILKADLNDEYYPIEQILGGKARNLDIMYNAGLNKIINISDFSIHEMLEMQKELQDKYKDKWEPICPQAGKHKLLWLIGEIGEVIDVVKKNGDIRSAEDSAVRKDLVEELADVLMYFNDVLLCYGITEEELKQAYISKFERNMKRW